MDQIQTPLTQLKSPHNHPSSISAYPNLCPTSSQHSLFISGYPRSTTNIILVAYNWSLLPVCLTLSLESTVYFSPSTSFQSIHLWLACSCSYHIFLLCQLTTPTIHNPLSLSLLAQNLPLSQIFPTIDSLPALRLTLQTLWLDHFFWASHFLFLVSSLLFLFGSVQQIKLAIRQLLGACQYSVSYRIVVLFRIIVIVLPFLSPSKQCQSSEGNSEHWPQPKKATDWTSFFSDHELTFEDGTPHPLHQLFTASITWKSCCVLFK